AIACEITIRPSTSTPLANSQCTISARGCILFLEVGDQRPSHRDREEQPGRHHEQRRLDHEPPEPLAGWVQKRQPVRLDERPDEPGEDSERPEQRNHPCPPAMKGRPGPYVCLELCLHLFPSGRRIGTTPAAGPCRGSGGKRRRARLERGSEEVARGPVG